MQKLNYKSSSFLVHQKLFIELTLELCDSRSLDSYRAKVAGPLSLLNELNKLIDDWKKNKIKAFETVDSCKKELINILNKDEVLIYGRSSKENFIKILNGLKDDKKGSQKEEGKRLEYHLPSLEYTLYYLLTINQNYIENLIAKVESLLKNDAYTQYSTEDELYNHISRCTGFLISELTSAGLSKSYISAIVRSIFLDSDQDFETLWQSFKNKIHTKEETQFVVIFKLSAPEGKLKRLVVDDIKQNTESLDSSISRVLEKLPEVKNYISPGPASRFVVKEVKALDHYQALKNAKTELANLLDLMHLGHYDIRIEIKSTAVVVDTRHPEKSAPQNIHYQIDGQYRSHKEVYKSLSDKIKSIKNKTFIAKEVVDKIEAALRFLRTGSEAIELEQKYLNYWIGLENVFSNYNVDMSTFLRIKKHFTIAHIVSYTKRNAYYLHKTIKRLDVERHITGYNANLKYLLEENTFQELAKLESQYPLLTLRSKNFKDTFLNSEECEKALKRHKETTEQHLTRMYRIRNELVHNAATFQNIENITGNLRYYLLFVINKTVEFFSECKSKDIHGKYVDMDDFFLYQEIIWQGIQDNKYDFEYLLSVPHPVSNIV